MASGGHAYSQADTLAATAGLSVGGSLSREPHRARYIKTSRRDEKVSLLTGLVVLGTFWQDRTCHL